MAHVQVAAYGERLKAIAVDFVRLIHSPSTCKDSDKILILNSSIMKYPLLIPVAFVCVFALIAFSQESLDKSTDSTESKTKITGELAVGKTTEAAPQPEPIDFEVIKSHSQRIQVKEASEISGVPAPEGMVNLTVELVKKPELAELPPLPLLDAKDPAVTARVEEYSRSRPDIELLLVSASVFNHTITQFRIQPSAPNAKEISGWSNIDFNHFSGFSSYQVQGDDKVLRSYGLIMSVGELDGMNASVNIPKLPQLATSGPAFVLTEGDINDPKTKQIIEGLHSLYKVEGKRLAEAYRKRMKEEQERKAYLLANPPKPKDVTIRFWNRDGSTPR